MTRRNIRKVAQYAREVGALSEQVRALAEDVSKLVDMAPEGTVLARIATGIGAIQRVLIDDLLDAALAVLVRLSGVDVGTRRILNFVAGSGVTLTIADDDANAEVDITIASSLVGLTDGDKGDITVSSSGTNWQIDPSAVGTTEIANSAVTFAKIQDMLDGRLLGRRNTSGGPPEEILPSTTRFSLSGTAFDIATDAIDNTRLRDSGALSVIGRAANSSGNPADISATAASGAVLRESGSVLGFGTIATAGIANDAITPAKLDDGSALSVLGRSANSAGDRADIQATAASGAVLRESGSTLGFGTILGAVISDYPPSSGSYEPTLTNTTNIDSSTTNECKWLRLGSYVHVTGTLSLNATASGACVLGVALPVSSNLAEVEDLSGPLTVATEASYVAGVCYGDATNNRATLRFYAIDGGDYTLYFAFGYEVI